MPTHNELASKLPLHQREVIADAAFFASSEAQLAQRTSAIQQRGVLLGAAYISRGDKPGGVEAGNRVYIRDKRYYHALADILTNQLTTTAINPERATASFIEMMKKYIYEGLPTNADQELPGITSLMRGIFGSPDKYYLLDELDKLKSKDPKERTSSKFNKLFEQYANTKIAAAQQMIAIVNSKLAAIATTTEPGRAEEIYQILLELETQGFANNPVLFEIFIQEIEKPANKYNVESWLTKLDSADPNGKPGVNRTDMTGTIKKTINLPGLRLRGIASYLYNRFKSRDPAEVFSDPYLETVANRHAMNSGMRTQDIQVGYSSYQDSSLKPVIFVRWQPGMSTLQDLAIKPPAGLPAILFRGGKKAFTNVLAYKDDDGVLVSASKLFRGLGKQFANMLLQGDRDGIGKGGETGEGGQNKGVVVVDGKFEFFGFDFGKAYDPAASILRDQNNLDDAFNFTQPSTDPQKALANFHIFTDTSYSERLFGVQLLAFQLLRYQIQHQQLPVTADNVVAMQAKLMQIKAALLTHPDVTPQMLDQDLAQDPMLAFKEQLEICAQLASKDNVDPATKAHLTNTIYKIQQVQQMAEQNLNTMLQIFQTRLTLTKQQADALAALESLAALPNATVYSLGKETVLLSQPYVAKQHRIPLQFEFELENGNYVLNCDDDKRAQVMANINAYLHSLNINKSVVLQGSKIVLDATLLEHLNSEKIFGFVQSKGLQPKIKQPTVADAIETAPAEFSTKARVSQAARTVASDKNKDRARDLSADMQEIAQCFAVGVEQQIQELQARKFVAGSKSAQQLEVLGGTADKLAIFIDQLQNPKQVSTAVLQRSNIMNLQHIVKTTAQDLTKVGYPGTFARFMTHVAQAVTSLINCIFNSDIKVSHRTSGQKFKQALKFSAHEKTLEALKQNLQIKPPARPGF